MGHVLPFTGKSRPTSAQRTSTHSGGTVEIWPSEDMGGSWAVYHRSRSGDSLGHWGSFLAFDDADREAHLAAAHYGAAYDGAAHV